MKKLTIKFALRQPHSGGWLGVIQEARRELERRTLVCEGGPNNTLVAHYIHTGWERDSEDCGHHSGPENTFWDIPLSGMRFTGMTATYDNALLPGRIRGHLDGDYEWLNGESVWHHGMVPIILTCLPARKTVAMSVEYPSATESSDVNRRAFIGIQYRVERMLKLTKASQRLIAALRATPLNKGRIRRFTNDLFVNIARLP